MTRNTAGELIGPNGVRVRAERCTTCVFRPGNLMQLEPGRLKDLIDMNEQGGWLTCHQTLVYATGRYDTPAVCKGWEQSYGLGPTMELLIAIFGREDVGDGTSERTESDPQSAQ